MNAREADASEEQRAGPPAVSMRARTPEQAGKDAGPPPSLMKKMGCHIAGETWVPTARRERTDSTTKITSGSSSEGRGHAVPAPPAGEAGVEEQLHERRRRMGRCTRGSA